MHISYIPEVLYSVLCCTSLKPHLRTIDISVTIEYPGYLYPDNPNPDSYLGMEGIDSGTSVDRKAPVRALGLTIRSTE
mgnify:FL=1